VPLIPPQITSATAFRLEPLLEPKWMRPRCQRENKCYWYRGTGSAINRPKCEDVFRSVTRAVLSYENSRMSCRTGRFDSSDNPVLAVIETDVTPNVGSRIVRTGSTWGTPTTFLLSDDTDIDAQLLGTPSFKAILSNSLLGDHGAFVALNQHATYSHVYDRRVRNFPGQANVTDSIDFANHRPTSDPGDPQTGYWPMFESQLMGGGAGDLAAFVFNTDNSPGTRADVWPLIGQNNGSNWYAYHIAEDDLLGNFYDRSMGWVSA